MRKIESLLDSPGPNVSVITVQSECDPVRYTDSSQPVQEQVGRTVGEITSSEG